MSGLTAMWIAYAVWDYCVQEDQDLGIEMLDDLISNFGAGQKSISEDNGLYWSRHR